VSRPSPSAAAGRRSAIRRLASYISRNRGYYAVWLASTLAYTAGFLSIPLLVGWAIDAYLEQLGAEVVARRAQFLALVALATAAVRFYSRTLVFNAAREIEYEIRNDLFAHLERLPQSFYFGWRTGDIMSRCVNDVNAVRLLLGVGLLNLVQTPILYVGAITAMLTLDAGLALFVILPYPLFILAARTLGRSIHHWSLSVQEGLAELSNRLQESISGIAVVKAYAMEGVTARRFRQANRDLYRRQLRLVRANAAMPSVVMLLPAAAMWIVLVIGGQRIMQRLDELLSVEPSIVDRPDVIPAAEIRGEIEFRDLSFHYPGHLDQPALRGVNLRVPVGTTLGVVGPVGSGKSTLASLIPRLYEVPEGSLFIDGMDVNRIPLHTLRSRIAMVPQESFLFSMTLADNVAFGLERTDAEAVRLAALRAQLTKDVADLPDGYDTVVGERGVMLSGGQRQRAALARALALDPRILILDDTLSAVDAETEVAIRRELQQVFRGRTVVVVSSRVSAVQTADRIVVLDGGRIVESGSHQELVAAGGLYARLAREQAEEENLEGVA
jgi:ATP-binding cassette subfamily B protein